MGAKGEHAVYGKGHLTPGFSGCMYEFIFNGYAVNLTGPGFPPTRRHELNYFMDKGFIEYDCAMTPKLIFLHIPKTGGSSQRLSLYDLYRRENVYWFGIDDADHPARTFSERELDSFAVVGGHKPMAFYPRTLEALYTCVLRDPVARVCSLFTHITQPLLRDTVKNRDQKYTLWLQRGMDPDSILNSLANCAEFRRQVADFQCGFLSRYTPDFQGALKTMAETPCLIGTAGQTAALNHYLGELLCWQNIPEKRMNRSRSETIESILAEPGAQAAIEGLVREDSRLFHHIMNAHGGLYHNIAEPERFSRSLSSRQFPPAISEQGMILRNLSVYCKGYAGVRNDGRGGASLVLANFSEVEIDCHSFPALKLCYRVLDREGCMLSEQFAKAPLAMTIPAGGQSLADLQFTIPRAVLPNAHSLRIEVMINGRESIAQINPLHAATAVLVPLL